MNTRNTIILTIVIAIVTFGVATLVSKAGSGAPAPVTQNPDGSASPIEDTGPQTYTNTTSGITFTYPGKYALEEKDVTSAQGVRHTITLVTKADKELIKNIGTPVEGPTSITIDIFQNSKNQKLFDWIKNTPESNYKQLVYNTYASTTFAGKDAVAYSWDGLFRANSIVFAHKNNIIMISMTSITAQDVIWKDFASILQSFKLK